MMATTYWNNDKREVEEEKKTYFLSIRTLFNKTRKLIRLMCDDRAKYGMNSIDRNLSKVFM